ncbi:MAG: helix-turn-helix transcriptional regulator [Gammaproteobacteria bacterium]|nr:helix-turn-helix transcriptional regulator [Gammaproteobacteria bacterium]
MTPATLRFWTDRFIWTSPVHVGGETSRPAIAILVGGWGDLAVTQAGVARKGRAFVIAPNVRRSVAAEQGFYSFNLDPVHRLCRCLRQECLASGPVLDVGERLGPEMRREIAEAIAKPQDCAQAHTLSERILEALFPAAAALEPVDGRIATVAAWLREHLPTRPHLPELAALAGLSPSRLTHLFTRELGVSIKSYLLAMKMRKAAELFGADRSLTEVAYAMGFADSAHLTRAFKSYFSVTPSLLANRQIVRLEVCGGPDTQPLHSSREPTPPVG